jgi:hypothetical protein
VTGSDSLRGEQAGAAATFAAMDGVPPEHHKNFIAIQDENPQVVHNRTSRIRTNPSIDGILS